MADDSKKQQKINALKEELNNLLNEEERLYKKIASLTDKQLSQLRQQSDLEEKIKIAVEQASAKREQGLEYLEKQVAKSREYLENINKLGTGLDENNLKTAAALRHSEDQIALLKRQLSLNVENRDEIVAALKQEQKKLDSLRRQKEAISNVQQRMDKLKLSNTKVAGAFREMQEAMRAGPGTTMGMFASVIGGPLLRAGLGLLRKGFNMLKTSVIDVFFAIDNVTHALQRATGMGEKYNDGMVETYDTARKYGITMEILGNQYQTLIGTVSDFSLETEAAGRRVAETGAYLERVGVQANDFAAGIQNSMKMFGQSMLEAEETARELYSTAIALNVPPQELAASYGQMGGQLAKLGRDGPQAFKELARVSKITGLEMKKVLDITNKFDTFESAAEMTGQLNAALGGNFVNAMDMMMETDPTARFEQIRNAISSTGLSFDDMSYYQKQFYTNALGLSDVGDLALMMSGNMDMMSGSTEKSAADYEELARQAEITMSLQEKFNAFLADMAPILMDLMDKAHEWIDTLRDNDEMIEEVRSTATLLVNTLVTLAENWEWIVGAMVGVPALFGLISFMMTINTATQIKNIAANTARIAQAPALIAAMQSQALGQQIIGKSGDKAAAGTYKFALGALAIGAAVFLAAAGIALMAYSFAHLLEVAEPGEVMELALAIGVIAVAGYALYGSAGAFAVLGAGLLVTAGALAMIKTADLEALATFAQGMSAMTFGSVEKLAEMLTEVAEAMEKIPEERAFALQATMNTAAAAAEMLEGRLNNQGGAASPNTQSPNPSSAEIGGTIDIKFNNEMFEDRVVRLSRRESGRIVAEALRNEQ